MERPTAEFLVLDGVDGAKAVHDDANRDRPKMALEGMRMIQFFGLGGGCFLQNLWLQWLWRKEGLFRTRFRKLPPMILSFHFSLVVGMLRLLREDTWSEEVKAKKS